MGNKKKFLKLISVFILTLFICTSFIYADSSMRSARVSDVTGDVKIRKAGGEKLFPAVNGMGLTQGDAVICGKDGIAVLKMDEDKEIKIANNTQIMISQLIKTAADAGEQTSLSLLSGKVLITISKKLTKDSKFDIKTPTAVMGVRGTQWYSLISNGRTNIGVITGIVSVTNSTSGTSADVPAMTTTEVTADTPTVPTQSLELKALDLFVLQGIKDSGTLDNTLKDQLDKAIQEKQKLLDENPPPTEKIEEDEEYMFDPEYLIYEEDGMDYGEPDDSDVAPRNR